MPYKYVALVVLLFAGILSSNANLLLKFQEVESGVIATLSGSLTPDFIYQSTLNSNSGGLTDAFGGIGSGDIRLGYGSGWKDIYQVDINDMNLSITGNQHSGGVVQPGYSPSTGTIDLSPEDGLYVAIENGTTSFNTQILWADKTLTDFFAGTTSLNADITTAGTSTVIGNLQIIAIPEPATLGLFVVVGSGIVAFRRHSRRPSFNRRKSKKAEEESSSFFIPLADL